MILEKKENIQNRKCKPCRHRVRRSQLHSISAGAAKTPYPQPSSSFPNCDRFTGSQFGHLEFYNAARDLDDGGHLTSYGYVTSCRGGRPCPPASPIFSYIISFAKKPPASRMGAHKTVILKMTIMASVRQGWERNNGYLVKAGYPLFFCRHEKQ